MKIIKTVLMLALVIVIRNLAMVRLRGSGERAEARGAEEPDVRKIQYFGEKEIKTPLILLWNNYQEEKNSLYKTIFHRSVTISNYQ